MKAHYLRLCILLAGINLNSLALQAQNLTNLAGTWNGIYFSTPSQMTIMRSAAVFTNGPTHYSVVTNIFENSAFGYGVFQVNFLSNGTFTGPGNGTIAIGSQGEFSVSPDDGATISFRVNAAQDVAAGIDRSTSSVPGGQANINELNLILRAPSSFTTNDLTGKWSLKTFDAPASIIQQYASSSIVSNVTPLEDLLLRDSNSADVSSFGQVDSGSMTFATDGTLTGSLVDPFAGSFSIGAGGQVTVDIPDFNFDSVFFVNASKNTMFALHTEPGNNRQELVMLTKNPAAVDIAALQGLWKATSFSIPAQLLLSRDNNNYITDVMGGSDFGITQLSFAAGNDGFVTALFEGVPTTGLLTAGSSGSVTLTTTNALGVVETHPGSVNAAHDVITLVNSEMSAVVLTKSPTVTTNRQDFGLLQFGSTLVWAAGTNRTLQGSSSLNGGWTNVPGTLGQHEFTPAYTNAAGFFRVGQ